MATHSVNMIIKARDEASRKLLNVGNAAVSMGSMLKKAAIGIGAYLGVREIARFTKSSIDAFAEEELAVNQLNSALALLGKQGELEAMRQFASEMQKMTIVGDETVMQIMQLGVSVGHLSGTQLQEATKAAIGLSKALGIDIKAAMLLVAKAAAGNTSTFSRYGIVLNENLSTQEKFNEVLKIGGNAFKLAEAETKTYSGTIAQLKNAFGDVKELIGNALIPVFKEWAQNTTKWFQENQANIGIWAQKAVAYISYAKSVFFDFLRFMKSDWKTGIEVVFDLFLIALEATITSAVQLAIAGGRGIWKGVSEGIFGQEKYTGYKYDSVKTPGGLSTAVQKIPITQEQWDKEQKAKQQKLLDEIITQPMMAIKESWKKAADDASLIIKEIAPDLEKSLQESKNKLNNALANAGKSNIAIAAGTSGGFTPQDDAAKTIAKAIRNPSGYTLESGTLRFAPGSSANYQKNTADNTKKTNSLLSEIKQAIKDGYQSDAATNITLYETEFA